MAWGKKLFSNLVVTDRILPYILPDERGENSLCEGWVGSFTMLVALRMQRVV